MRAARSFKPDMRICRIRLSIYMGPPKQAAKFPVFIARVVMGALILTGLLPRERYGQVDLDRDLTSGTPLG
jgi:hypothetical protein